MTKEYKLNIFDVLTQIDKGNMSFYDNLSEDMKKAFVPVVVHKWMIGYASKFQLEMLDALVNTQIYQLHQKPELIYKLMVASSDGKNKRYKYLKTKSKKAMPSLKVDIISRYYRIGSREARDLVNILSVDDIIEIAEELGEDKTVIRKIKK